MCGLPLEEIDTIEQTATCNDWMMLSIGVDRVASNIVVFQHMMEYYYEHLPAITIPPVEPFITHGVPLVKLRFWTCTTTVANGTPFVKRCIVWV